MLLSERPFGGDAGESLVAFFLWCVCLGRQLRQLGL